MDVDPRRRCPDFIRRAERPAQPFGISKRKLDVAIDRPFLEKMMTSQFGHCRE
jgi:hypothetical protein